MRRLDEEGEAELRAVATVIAQDSQTPSLIVKSPPMTEAKLEEHLLACGDCLQLPVLLLHQKCRFHAEG